MGASAAAVAVARSAPIANEADGHRVRLAAGTVHLV
jgi:hypothetical protein